MSIQPVNFWRWIITLLLVLFISVPATNVTWFDGLPLSPYESLAVIINLVIIWGSNLFTQRPFRLICSATLLLLIIWQLIGAMLIPAGWSICLRRELEKNSLIFPCELSAQSNAGQYTLISQQLRFVGRNFPLYFMNEAPFNYTSEEEPNRHDMPYSFSATAFFHPRLATPLTITTNTPNTLVELNGQTQAAEIDEPLTITLAPQLLNQVTISFQTSRSDSDSILVQTNAQPFYSASSRLPSTWFIFTYQSIFSCLLLLMSVLSLYALFNMYLSLTSTQRRLTIYAVALIVVSLIWSKAEAGFFTLILLTLSVLFIAGHQPRSKFKHFMVIFLLLHSFSFTWALRPATELQLLAGGDDTLTHEHQARLVMKASSLTEFLQAGQSQVFYYQPLYRYLLGAIHKIFGESLWAATFVQTYLLSLAVLISLQTVKIIGHHRPVAFLSVLIFIMFAMFEDTPLKLAQNTYQEAVALPLFIMAILLAIQTWHQPPAKHLASFFLISLLWGLTISIRTNLTPALAAWLIFFSATLLTASSRARLTRLVLSGLAGLVVFPTLVVARNIIIAGRIQFFTSSLHPNLIDPLRPLFPTIGGASDLSISTVVITMLQAYHGRLSELFLILWQNMTTYYIGPTLLTKIGWGLAYLLLLYGLYQLPLKQKVILTILLAGAVLPMLFGSLFLHRHIASVSQANFLLAIILSLSVALLFSQPSPGSTHQPEDAT